MSAEIERIFGRVEVDTFQPPAGMVSLREPAEMLMEEMKRVKQSPQHIESARAMCEIADRLTDIAKTQVLQANTMIDLIRVNNDYKRITNG